jgi:HK97 family phage major capsid protein
MPLPTVDRRTALGEVRRNLNDLRRRRTETSRERDEARDAMNGNASLTNLSPTDLIPRPEFQRLQRATSTLEDLDRQISGEQERENYLLSTIANADAYGARTILEDPDVLDRIRNQAMSSQPMGDQNWGIAISREEIVERLHRRREAAGVAADLMTGGFGSGMMAAAGDAVLPSDTIRTVPAPWGIVSQLRRRVRLLDLLPTEVTDAKVIPYLVESGSLDTGGPAETAELSIVPAVAPTLTDATATIVAIAGYTHASRDTLSDVPSLANTIHTRLAYLVERRTENQILSGNGTGQNILGITNTTGIGAPASVAGDSNNADLIMGGIINVLQAEAEPDAIVVNPADWGKSAKLKASGSGQRLDSDGAYSDIPLTMWGLPLVVSTAITSGTALVGSFGMGAQLWVRQGLTLLTSDADQDDWVRRAVKVMGEWRVGLSVFRPAAFAKVTLAFAA